MKKLKAWARALYVLPEITRIRLVEVGPNDILFLSCRGPLDAQAAAEIKARFEMVTGLKRVVVSDMDIGVIREANALG